jgi:ubiquinol-cytochrome c reductase cytochrome b subunit
MAEWYVLWVYAILRSIPNKAGGVVAIGLVFAGLMVLPSMQLCKVEWCFWALVALVMSTIDVGAQEITPVTTLLGQGCTIGMGVYLLVPLAA